MNAHPIVLMTQAALDALGEVLDDGIRDPDRIDAVLERAGDALRGGLPLPGEVRRWIEHLSLEELGDSLTRAADRTAATPLPLEGGDLDALLSCVRERDRGESVLVGVQRACIGSRRSIGDVPGAEATLDLFAEVDHELGARVGRGTVEQALGMRIALQAEHGWTHQLSPGPEHATEQPEVLWPEGSVLVRPSDAVVASYVERGRHAAAVEKFATRDAAFAETLEATIGAFRITAQPISLIARRWERARTVAFDEGRATFGEFIPLELPIANAAASETTPTVTRDLGVLHPTDAEGLLDVSQGRASLTVLAGDDPVVRVSFGDRTSATEAQPGVWKVEIPGSREAITLVVECASGSRFATRLGLFDSFGPT